MVLNRIEGDNDPFEHIPFEIKESDLDPNVPGKITTFVSKNFCFVQGGTHNPPDEVADILCETYKAEIDKCKNSCSACKKVGCEKCTMCPLRHDKGDCSPTVGLFLQAPQEEEKNKVCFQADDAAWPIDVGRIIIFDGRAHLYGVWSPPGQEKKLTGSG